MKVLFNSRWKYSIKIGQGLDCFLRLEISLAKYIYRFQFSMRPIDRVSVWRPQIQSFIIGLSQQCYESVRNFDVFQRCRGRESLIFGHFARNWNHPKAQNGYAWLYSVMMNLKAVFRMALRKLMELKKPGVMRSNMPLTTSCSFQRRWQNILSKQTRNSLISFYSPNEVN